MRHEPEMPAWATPSSTRAVTAPEHASGRDGSSEGQTASLPVTRRSHCCANTKRCRHQSLSTAVPGCRATREDCERRRRQVIKNPTLPFFLTHVDAVSISANNPRPLGIVPTHSIRPAPQGGYRSVVVTPQLANGHCARGSERTRRTRGTRVWWSRGAGRCCAPRWIVY